MDTYLERIRGLVKINHLYHLKEEDIWDILEKSKAIILDGHFKLLSPNHTDTFFRFANISQFPYLVAKISKELSAWLKQDSGLSEIDVVLGPTSQGMFFAYDIARELNGERGTRAAYAGINKETGRPVKNLIEGFEINTGERVLIVNDMTTTGTGIEKLVNLAKEKGGNVVAVCLFANRGINEPKVNNIKNTYNFHSVIDLDMPYWPESECNKRCSPEKELIESRMINHLPIYTEEDAYNRFVQIRKLKMVA